MYDNLYDEGAKWWYLSTEALYEEFESARKADVRVVESEVSDFYIYTLEIYALAKGLSGLQALTLMKRYGVDGFLLNHFDLLHTQGPGYVIDEIDLMIRRRKRRMKAESSMLLLPSRNSKRSGQRQEGDK